MNNDHSQYAKEVAFRQSAVIIIKKTIINLKTVLSACGRWSLKMESILKDKKNVFKIFVHKKYPSTVKLGYIELAYNEQIF